MTQTGDAIAQEMAAQARKSVQEAVRQSLEAGDTFEVFKKKFDDIIAKQGWIGGAGGDTEEGRAWRARLNYDYWMRKRYSAGRYKQMSTSYNKKRRPFWRYVHGMYREPLHPRPQHVALNGMVFRCDNPIWEKIFPPNGHFCGCGVEPLTERQLNEDYGKDGEDPTPQFNMRKVTDPITGEEEEIPDFVDPGFGGLPTED